jgi:hypothetical protein
MVTWGARMTAGIGGTHKNLWFTWLVRLKSRGIDSTRYDHVQDIFCTSSISGSLEFLKTNRSHRLSISSV